jgi:hypothetical protein
MSLTPKLEAIAGQIEAILADGKVSIWEVLDTVKILGDAVKQELQEIGGNPTEEQAEDLLIEAWEWADGRWKLVEKADAAIKFPIYLAFAEAVDGPAIRSLVKGVLIPALARKLV